VQLVTQEHGTPALVRVLNGESKRSDQSDLHEWCKRFEGGELARSDIPVACDIGRFSEPGNPCPQNQDHSSGAEKNGERVQVDRARCASNQAADDHEQRKHPVAAGDDAATRLLLSKARKRVDGDI